MAEDNLVNQEIAKHTLRNAGHMVDMVGTGTEAVEAVRTGSYDAVLMDIHMPGMDGLTATKHIRALGGDFADLPIIALTADAMTGNREQFMSAGMNAFVSKPFDPPRLHATIARCVDSESIPGPVETEQSGESFAGDETATTLDPEVVEPMKTNQPDLWKRLVSVYLADADKRLQMLGQAVSDGDAEQIRLIAHTMKSANPTSATRGSRSC